MTDDPQDSKAISLILIKHGVSQDLQEGVDFTVRPSGVIDLHEHIIVEGPDEETGYEGDKLSIRYMTSFGGDE